MPTAQKFNFTKLPEIQVTSNVTTTDEVLVIGLLKGEETPTLVIGNNVLDDKAADHLDASFAAVRATGDLGEVWRLPAPPGLHVASVLAIGLGDGPKAESNESVRVAAGIAARNLEGVKSVVTTLGEIDIKAAAEGFLLGSYKFTNLRTQKSVNRSLETVKFLVAPGTEASAEEVIKHASVIGKSVSIARDLSNLPSNFLYPQSFCDIASDLAGGHGIKVEVLNEKELANQGYGGIVAVGKASAQPPRLLRLTYKAVKPKSRKTIALVGKGITYDSGGLSIKTAKGMETMTSDMSGAASVVGTIIAAATLKLPVNVIATIPLAENMINGNSVRPGDVITHYNGITSEILNTDAEGRLVLADAISRAVEDKPDYLIETSTLTGAQIAALGSRIFAVMGTEEFRDQITHIANDSGEKAWAMPLPEEMKTDIQSRVADICNISSIPEAGMLIAGLYLESFVPEGLPWAHLDIAGPSWNNRSSYGYTPKGGTGTPTRSLIAVLENISLSNEQ